ncbi:Zn-ribbon domain-containing OB-fold protein [Nocardioides sp. L-11A]|uniref:Zn-ribbon domain-containing OB-fold protein n=1 Tax=Nocardioides sp. L-11A TaxID=3043848 RepID=UPI00249AA0F6|nr:OB-fold domain-containing protein [Nocardioides sp. L-11A]
MTTTRLVDDALFASDAHDPGHEGVPSLVGSRCDACGTTTFPRQEGCPRCGGAGMADAVLPRSGTIWSATVQHFEPKAPYRHDGDFVPFGMGYVDLGDVIVVARLTENDPARLGIGAAVTLCTLPAWTDEDGTQVLTYGFRVEHPAGQEG